MARTPLTHLLFLAGLGLAALGATTLATGCGDKDVGDDTGGGGGDGGSGDDGGSGGDGGDDGGTIYGDKDEDGYTSDVDCDDEDAQVHPGATEICNGKDDDCDDSTSEADWIRIDETWYDSIQAAVDASVEGDAVLVCAGTFHEQLVIDKTVSIVSELGPEFAILDGSGMSGSVVTITGGTAVLQGFSIIGGTGADHRGDGDLQGGGLYIKNTGDTIIGETWIYDNTADRGGGVFVDEGSHPMFQYVVVASNDAVDGAGVYAHAASASFGSSEFYANVATGQGGGFSGYEADFTINTGIVIQNQAAQGGGAAVVDDSSLSSTGSDWGEPGSEDDNLPQDVWTEGGAYSEYGEGVTFSCNAAGCD